MNDGELEFQKIHNIFRPKILRYLTRLVGKDEAEDITQEVFIRVSQGLKTFRGESLLSTWIYRIATNAAVDRMRRSSFQITTPKSFLSNSTSKDEELKNALTRERTSSVEQQLIRKEMNECIRRFIDRLPENYRVVVILSELEQLKNDAIAKVLGVTLNTVKIRLHRARAKLKKELKTHCSFYRDEQNQLACDLKTAFDRFRKEY